MSPVLTPTKEELADAFNASRYVRRPITAEDVVDVMAGREHMTPDGINFQAWHDCYVDWFGVRFSADGKLDPATVEQLGF